MLLFHEMHPRSSVYLILFIYLLFKLIKALFFLLIYDVLFTKFGRSTFRLLTRVESTQQSMARRCNRFSSLTSIH